MARFRLDSASFWLMCDHDAGRGRGVLTAGVLVLLPGGLFHNLDLFGFAIARYDSRL